MKTAFVTGATGFVGSHLVDDLLCKGYKIKCSIRKTSNLQWLKDKDVELCEVDLSDKNEIKEAIRGSDYIFHLASVLFAQSEKEFIEGNVEITRNMVNACLEQETYIKRFVYLSSIVAAGSSKTEKPMIESDDCTPFTWYGKSKYESEQYILSLKDQLPFTILRPGAVYGPRDYAMYESFKFCRTGFNILLGDSDNFGSVIHIDDLICGIMQAAESGKTIGEIYFLANDDYIRQEEFNGTVIKEMGKKPLNIKIPYGVAIVIVFFIGIFSIIFNKRVLLNQQKLLELTEPYLICSSQKAKDDFNFIQKIPFTDGIKSTLKWYRDNNLL